MRTSQKERCEKLLEDAHLKLSSVASDIHGMSRRAQAWKLNRRTTLTLTLFAQWKYCATT
jgi:hypothetical protein